MKIHRLTFRSSWNVLAGTRRSQAAEMVIPPGEAEGGAGNRHDGDQWLFVLSGTGRARIGAKRIPLRRHSLLLIAAGEEHEIRNTGRRPLRTLNVYAPPQYRGNGEEK